MFGIFLFAAMTALSASVGCRPEAADQPASEGERSGSQRSESDAGNRRLSAGVRSRASADSEDDTADFPQEIAGSFLTCAQARSDTGGRAVTFGCRIEHGSQIVDISRYAPEWSVEDETSGVELETTEDIVRSLPLGSAWQTEIQLPRGLEKGQRVRVYLDFGGGRSGSVSRSLAEASSFVTMNQPKAYHLGDASLLGTLIGSCGLQMATTATLGTTLKLNVVVEAAKTSLRITLGKLCGVDYSANSVTLKGANGAVLSRANISPRVTTFNVTTPALDPGTYSLEISTSAGLLGWDDFVLGEIAADFATRSARVRIEPMP